MPKNSTCHQRSQLFCSQSSCRLYYLHLPVSYIKYYDDTSLSCLHCITVSPKSVPQYTEDEAHLDIFYIQYFFLFVLCSGSYFVYHTFSKPSSTESLIFHGFCFSVSYLYRPHDFHKLPVVFVMLLRDK